MEIKNLGVRELTENEMNQINGGNWIAFGLGWIAGQYANAAEWFLTSNPGGGWTYGGPRR